MPQVEYPTPINGPVAQLGARLNRTEEAEGSNPSRSTRMVDCRFEIADWHPRQSTILNLQAKLENGPIAQLGARLNGIEKVESSNLSGSTQTISDWLSAVG
jgi:hypothetical protein